jgi:D-alanyl-D-alanine carboxypeptidase (penicillin-binding protein 5/6)
MVPSPPLDATIVSTLSDRMAMRPLSRRISAITQALTTLALVVSVSMSAVQVAAAAGRSSDLVDGRKPSSQGIPLVALPSVTMKAGVLSDGDGHVLWARTPDARRSMASITKIMTAVVALENSSLTETVTIPRAAVTVGESSAYLVAGETFTMRDVLTAMLVKSGNDAAVATAMHVGGTEAHFVEMMNQKAAELGLASTHFANPHGLDQPGHYSTADDLAVLARYAMSKPAFRSIVGLKKTTIGRKPHRHVLESTDLLLGNYTGAVGVKTGNTNKAGYSVVSAAQRNGVMLYAVVLGTSSDRQRFRDAQALLDWGFAHYRPQTLATSGTVVAEAAVSDFLDVSVPVEISQDVTAAVLDLNGPIHRKVTVAPVRAPVKTGDHIGAVTFTQGGHLIAGIPLTAVHAVGAPNILERLWIGVVRGWRALFGVVALA